MLNFRSRLIYYKLTFKLLKTVIKDTINLKALKLPIGEFNKPDLISSEKIKKWIKDIELFPSRLKALSEGLSDVELDQKYRPHG